MTRSTALLSVLEAIASGVLHAEIVAVVLNQSTAEILERGRGLRMMVTTRFVSAKGLGRKEYKCGVHEYFGGHGDGESTSG